MKRLPVLAPPVERPELVHPHRCVDVHHGTPEALFAVRINLVHGANHNDPAAYAADGPESAPVVLGGWLALGGDA